MGTPSYLPTPQPSSRSWSWYTLDSTNRSVGGCKPLSPGGIGVWGEGKQNGAPALWRGVQWLGSAVQLFEVADTELLGVSPQKLWVQLF